MSMLLRRSLVIALLLLLVLGRPNAAHAQSGAVVNGAVGVAAADGSSDLEVSGGIGYRFNRAIGFGIELTHVPDFERDSFYGLARPVVCCGIGEANGHATLFTTNVRIEIPTTMRRVIPFVVGGGGIASVTERIPIYYAVPLATDLTARGISMPVQNILPGPQNFTATTLAMALTLGGGASVLLTDHLSIDGDLRVLKLLAENGKTIGRFQVGASYRF